MRSLHIILLIFYSSVLFSQENNTENKTIKHQATYSISWQPDSLNVNSKIKNKKYKLLMFENGSLYVDSNRLKLDSLIQDSENRGTSFALLSNMNSLPQPNSNNRILKQYSKNTLWSLNQVSGTTYQYSEKLKLMDWKIEDDIKIINTYKCQKATVNYSGRNYIAWFTSELPINDGPYKFSGLPGLIILLHDTKNQYSFELINFQKTNYLQSFDVFNNAKIISKKDYKKIRNAYINNPIVQMEGEGAVFSEETKRQIIKMIRNKNKNNNNRIELTDD